MDAVFQHIAELSADACASFLFAAQRPAQTQTKLEHVNPRGGASRESGRYKALDTKYGEVKTLSDNSQMIQSGKFIGVSIHV